MHAFGAGEGLGCLVDLLPDPSAVFDLNARRLVVGNAALCQVLEVERDAIVDLPASELAEYVHPEDLGRNLAVVDLLARAPDSEGLAMDCRLRRVDGGWKTYEIAIAVAGHAAERGPSTLLAVARPRAAAALTPDALAPSAPPWIDLAARARCEGLWALDFDDDRLDTDEVWAAICCPGRPPPATGREWIDQMTEADGRRLHAWLATVRTGLSPLLDCELKMTVRNEETRWVRVSGRAVADGDGKPRGVAGTAVDIDAMRRRVDELAAESRWFRALVEGSPDGVVVHRAGLVLYANVRFARMVGLSGPSEIVGRPLLSWVAGPDQDAVSRAVAGEPVGGAVEARLVSERGETVAVELATVALPYRGQPAMAVVLRDVQQRRDLQARLALADRMATLGLLAAGVAHEINNPLAYVTLSVETLSTEVPSLTATVHELLGRIRAQHGDEALQRLTGDLDRLQFRGCTG